MNNDAAARASRRYLLLDERLVDHVDNLALRVGRAAKAPNNPLFAENMPWEPRFDNLYPNVIRDPHTNRYRCWYSPFVTEAAHAVTPADEWPHTHWKDVVARLNATHSYSREMGLCYAESADGLIWAKPLLGIYPWQGQESNILAVGPHGAGVFLDEREPEPSRRYKMIAKSTEEQGAPLAVAFSADGLHWGEMIPCIHDVKADTHNNALFVPELGKYVAFTRQWPDGQRAVYRAESDDFLNWTDPEEVLRGSSRMKQVYSMPVFRYAGIYLGLPAILDIETDRVHTELAWSPDTRRWMQVDAGTPLIPCANEPGAYDWGCVYAASGPISAETGISLYYGGSDGVHTDFRKGYFCLATLRTDGFAGYASIDPSRDGSLTTTEIALPSDQPVRVRVNADAEDGSIVVRVRHRSRGEIAAGTPLTGTLVDHEVSFGNGVMASARDTISLDIAVRNATLYSFVLEPVGETRHAK